jgi:hypothetical protein
LKFIAKIVKLRKEVMMKFTNHALIRMNQRKISDKMLKLALRYGCVIYNAGAKFVFVRKKDVPEDLPKAVAEKIEGIVIVINPVDETIVTVYKNKDALREIKRKIKRYDGKSPRGKFKLNEVF